MTSLDDQAEIRRQSTGVTRTGSFLVGVWFWHIVGELAGTLEHLALVVGTIFVFHLLGHLLHFVNSVGDANQVTPGNTVEGVASSANLAVDLITTTNAENRIRQKETDIEFISI